MNRYSTCDFKWSWKFDTEKLKYITDTTSSNFESHSHNLDRSLWRASGTSKVSNASQLMEVDLHTIKSLSEAGYTASHIRNHLSSIFQSRDYDYDLVYRIAHQAKVDLYGGDEDMVNKFIELGEKIRREGGIFEIRHSVDGQITDVFVVPANLKKYAEQYADFITHDGSFDMNEYKFTTMFTCMVDALFKTVLFGFSICNSENSKHIITSLKIFGLDKEGINFMTDEGTAYPVVADVLKYVS